MKSGTREKSKRESQITVSKCSKKLIQANIEEAGFKQSIKEEHTEWDC